MLKNMKEPKEIRDAMLSLLPTCGTLAGIAIGLASAINLRPSGGAGTLADEILLVSALGFLIACYLIFFTLRSSSDATRATLMVAIDWVFLGSLTLIVFSGFIVVFKFI